MSMIKATPWDEAAFGMHTAEVVEYSEAALREAAQTPGHYTIKVDPLADKQLLHKYGFYYCDTLLEPYCTAQKLQQLSQPEATVSKQAEWEGLLAICHGAFAHGRFHRDFNLDQARADLRYDNWLRQLYDKGAVYGLYWNRELAGFIAHADNNLVLHAVAASQRGKGRAKYWWSAVSGELLAAGHAEVKSSISAANLAVLNLYASLGFSFRHPLDVYHCLVQAAPRQSR
ncbi:MAG: GNAT family N-acetyltransferase [Nitrosomonadales bacterium]|nr:GNAT family N-acetyltransferase [Nitrosomonadales bacterium]